MKRVNNVKCKKKDMNKKEKEEERKRWYGITGVGISMEDVK